MWELINSSINNLSVLSLLLLGVVWIMITATTVRYVALSLHARMMLDVRGYLSETLDTHRKEAVSQLGDGVGGQLSKLRDELEEALDQKLIAEREKNIAEEANPIMLYLLDLHPGLFVFIKIR